MKNLKKSLVSNCRSCSINRRLVGEAGKHKVIDTGLFCPVCKSVNKWIYHGQHDQLSGDSLECNKCNSYIIYTDGNSSIWKDEIYLDNNYMLIRDLEYLQSYIIIDNEQVYAFPNLIDFSDSKALFNKLKTIVIFL